MTIRKAAVVIALLAGFVATPVQAAESWHTSTLAWVYPSGAGDFVLGFDTNSSYCTNPGSPTKYMYVVVGQNGVTAEGAKTMFAAALAALAMGKTVVPFDSATYECYVSAVLVNK